MKRLFIGTGCLIICLMLASCGFLVPDFTGSIYNDFTFESKEDKCNMSGEAKVADSLTMVYVSALEDTSLKLKGELKNISGDVQIVYISPDKKETVVADCKKVSRYWKINTTAEIKKGSGRLEFRAEKSTFRFQLLFSEIDPDKIAYLGVEAEKEQSDSENSDYAESEEEGINGEDSSEADFGNDYYGEDDPESAEQNDSETESTRPEENGKVIKEVSVDYIDQNDNCVILETPLKQDTKVRVLTDVTVTDSDDHNVMSFYGFSLEYEAEDGSRIPVMRYKTNECALWGYKWRDSFSQDLVLPAGTNKLLYHGGTGSNYNVRFRIRVMDLSDNDQAAGFVVKK